MSKNLIILLCGLLYATSVFSVSVDKIEPGNWWVGMKNNRVELLVYGKNLLGSSVTVVADDVRIIATENADSPDYLFVTLEIGENQKAKPIQLQFRKDKFSAKVTYELKERSGNAQARKGFDTSDVVYLLMPDRFANGDATNDSTEDASEKANRENPNGRHGGDIAGMIERLGYLQQLGVTTIWPTPLWESNHTKNSYHGYACTDFYQIDSRYGTNSLYRKLAAACHQSGLKLIMDVVPNHCSISHPWVKNPPMKDWIHPAPANPGRTLAISAWNDPHVSDDDFRLNKDGWFSPLMPDLNQNNEKVLRYFVQNTIWWIEYANLDGLRVDTYPYCERSQIAKWTKAILDEYPAMNIVGEVWQPHASSVAYWQKDAKNYDGYNSNLPCVMDFPLMDAMKEAFNGDDKNRGRQLNKLYGVLAQDYLYAYPDNILTFADNHDTERFATLIGKNVELYKSALAFLLTVRGIPQLYYGTEIMMNSDPEGVYTGNANRKEMSGGWKGDVRNVFSPEGRNAVENAVYDYIRTLLTWRKETPVIHHGKLKHFKPRDGVYVYFRYDESHCVMVIVNANSEEKVVSTDRFGEVIKGYRNGVNVVTKEAMNQLEQISVQPESTLVIELSM